ncbi:GRIP and coiled-coil domain-containing protein 2 [Hemicordylus capensis]|uniref:GRIP and coiled-coil domain-containing protein 2 n=1 Tax=Hemicordylus capensis TaxID=884348 RepID=UPI0023048E8D|nr:GRIP and coiled-coil domain-containing protein 2 [Hemicordylus capensis]
MATQSRAAYPKLGLGCIRAGLVDVRGERARRVGDEGGSGTGARRELRDAALRGSPLAPSRRAGPSSAMELQDGSQEMAASPSTPATGKSRLDTLPREDLIKFSKKQMMLIQKVKLRCTELEKEIQELKTKSAAGGTDDIIQALTERLDAVLLEKAEIQQQCQTLKKENVKRQQEAEAAVAKEEDLQKKFAQSNTGYLKEIERLKTECVTAQSKYNDSIAMLQSELYAEVKKQEQLTEQLELLNNRQEERKRIQEQVQKTNTDYEQQILNLTKQLEASSEDKEEIVKLHDVIESNSQCYQNEIDRLDEELEKLKTTHQKEVSELRHQLETSAHICEEERNTLDQLKQDLIEKHRVKEKSMQDELHACKENYEHELEYIKQTSPKNEENQTQIRNVHMETEMAEKVRHLQNSLKELESQHSILQDELTYMNNIKMKLEVEVQHTKDEYFHEREDLEFKINELQLTKEDHCCVIERLKSELQAIREQQQNTTTEHSLEIQDLVEKHGREICELKQTLLSNSEKEKRLLFLEIQDLKEQCQTHMQEKEEAIAGYENLRETMETLQAELGESAGKISREFQSMKQQQASDVDELQKKLRAAFNEKDVLLETVNNLREEVEQLSSTREEVEKLRHKIGTLQEANEKLITSLHQKETAIKELEEKESVLSLRNNSILDEMKCSTEEIENLQEECKVEQGKVAELQQQVEALRFCNHELERKAEELTEKLKGTSVEKEENQQRMREFEQQLEALQQDREHLSSEVETLHCENSKIKEERDRTCKELETIAVEKGNWLMSKEQAEHLEMKLQIANKERDHLAKLLDEEKAFKSHLVSQLHSFLEQMGSKYPDENKEDSVVDLLQIANESLAKMKEEKQSLSSQKDENIFLQQEMRRLQEESTACCMELRSQLDDSEKEKRLLREELEGALSEKEALQLDIQELKHASEKVRNENKNFLAHIEDISAKCALHESKIKEQEEKLEEEQKNLNLILEQKETELNRVQADLSLLKSSVEESSVNSDQQSSEIQKIVNLENQLKEKEEKLNKFKAVAVKLRKELDSSKKEVQSLRDELEVAKLKREQLSTSMRDVIQGAESYKNLLTEFDKQAEQLDFERERTRNFEHHIDDLKRQLESSTQQQDQLHSANEDFLTRIGALQSNTKLLETQLLETQRAKAKVDKELEAEKLLKNQKIKDHTSAVKEVEELQTQLQKEKKHLQKVLEELEWAKKGAQKSTLMDMEIADYDRLVKELNQKIANKGSRIEDLEQEINIQKQKQETLQEEIKSFQAAVQQHEEKNSKIKVLLVKTKKELADSKQSENELLRFQASLKGELEASQQQVEVYKIQLADLTSEKHKIQEHLRTSVEQQQRVLSSYQQRLAALQEECSAAKAEHATVTSEFESYKVRVHNVLKQKTKSASQAEMEVTKQEREHMEKVIDQLKIKLQDTQHNLQINATELQALQTEHDTLLERHNKILQETVAKEAELREKLCTIQSENMVMKSEHTQTVNQLTAQNEALRNSFRDQVRHLQEDHRKTVETLQQQLSKLEAQLFQLRSEPSTKSPASSNLPTKNLRERRNTDLPLLDVHTVAREEGEGMETTDTESVSSASTYVQSLEQLLNTPDAKFEPPQWQTELTKEELIQQLNTISKSADHLNGLLRESEATNAILMEQIKLLKSEVRRLERNQEREKSVANLEYLKNVLLQFIFLKSGSERERLLPVIDTMLQLSPEEKGKLVAIAQGEEESSSQPSGWASYLHSWSGLR